ncbi:MAG: BON domain-containing protein [Leptolyngbya sp. DLM2.Bin15]|nr:MAG: BON domain-containing protein [Leptolyngbya sp. DLM2.Bin15]
MLGSFLLLGATAACSESSDTATTDRAATDSAATDSGVRSDQRESDARAREQRDGNPAQQTSEDLAVDVRNSLENELPGSRLAVDVDGDSGMATIDGSVVSQEQFNEIEPLVMAFEGIRSVDIKAEVKPN